MPDQLQAALHHAAFAPIHNQGWLHVTGEDRVRWLNGMVTNSIVALTPGQGCENFVLNAQGRIQAGCTAWLEPDHLLLQTADPAALLTLLDRFIIMDDVELEVLGPPASPEQAGRLITGPQAAEVLAQLELPVPQPMHLLRAGDLLILHTAGPLLPRFELWGFPDALPRLPLPELAAQDLLALRLLEGTALVGTDIRERDLPQEAALAGQPSPALHFSKGCYLGQEIVERIRSRGQVHRMLHGFSLQGELPTLPAPLLLDGKPVGELTSAARIPLDSPLSPGLHPGLTLALAIVRREAVEGPAAGPLTYPGGVAQPVTLPYATAVG